MATILSGHLFGKAISRVEAKVKEKHANLRKIIQRPDERVAVLEVRRHAPFSCTSYQGSCLHLEHPGLGALLVSQALACY
jgi:hypothetical protein